MLDFICELDAIMNKWPEDVDWNIPMIADYTGTAIPQVVDYLSDALGKELEVNETISYADGTRALNVLKKRMETQLAARARRAQERRDKAIRAYDLNMDKIRVLLVTKNWRSAYRTMSYFLGRYETSLPEELLLSAYSECLRLGTKAEANLQELGYWLRKAVCQGVANPNRDTLEDALDFVDAFGEYFVQANAEKGRKLLASVIEEIEEPISVFDLTAEYHDLRSRFGIIGETSAS